MAQTNRMKAAKKQRKHYQGAVCKKNADHGGLRYTSSGQCVQCSIMAANKRTGEIRAILNSGVTS